LTGMKNRKQILRAAKKDIPLDLSAGQEVAHSVPGKSTRPGARY
jgi:hypothetical protein